MKARPGPATVHGVVFDLDGTLVDAFEGIATAVNAARSRFGLAPLPRSTVTGMVGRGVDHLIAEALRAEDLAEGARVFRETYARVCEDETRAVPDARPTLEALAAHGVRAGVASNKPVAFTERILRRLGLRPLLAAVDGPETAGALKPDPAMIRHCLATMEVSPDAAVYVGDMPLDVETGGRAGVRVVLVAGGASSESALRATGVPPLHRLLDLLPELGLGTPKGTLS